MPQQKRRESTTTFRTLIDWRREYLPLETPAKIREDKYAGKPDELGAALANQSVMKITIGTQRESVGA